RHDRADGPPFGVGHVGGLPVRGDREFLRDDTDVDRLASRVGGRADRYDRVASAAADLGGLPIRGEGENNRAADVDRLASRVGGGVDRGDVVRACDIGGLPGV